MKAAVIIVLILFLIVNFVLGGKTGIVALLIILLSIAFWVLKNIAQYIKTRTRRLVHGKLIRYTRISFGEVDSSNYKLEIAFNNPADGKQKNMDFYILSHKRPQLDKQYQIWVNTKNINKSILYNKFNIDWFIMILLGVILLGTLLFYFIENIRKLFS